eukprot:m51a1_g4573 hypothetical protein (571) ;mRNA; f:157189-159406
MHDRSSCAATGAVAIAAAAVVIAVAPIVALVAFSRPVLDAAASAPLPAAASSTVQPLIASSGLPTKWAAKYLLPQYFQEDRGTCWVFATIGWLEQSYRQNGIEKGFLEPDQYVRLNNQAFGISVIEACRGHPDVCDALGEGPWVNQTAGGETWWLYSLSALYHQVLPSSVCPYTDEEHELECPGMDKAVRFNPIRFDIRGMDTAYSVADSKALMVARDRPLLWSSLMHTVMYYMPCNDTYWARQAGCNATNRVRCPTDKYYNSDYCARFESAMYNQDGEFFMQGNTVVEGGHAMNAVGYNDEFVTKQGQKGGFIIKNSWHDLTYGADPDGRGARGSHSVAYWMQEISAWDEKALCPGPLNPDNWLSCVAQQPGPTMPGRRAKRTVAAADGSYDISQTCLSERFMEYLVNVTLQPTEFVCRDAAWCAVGGRHRYFLVSVERSADQRTMQVCMLHYDAKTAAQATICTPYVNPSLVAYIWAPVQAQQDRLRNDPDFCGYFFWPYEMMYQQTGVLGAGNTYTTNFDIVWDDSSYIANMDRHPEYDYSFVKASTAVQRSVDFGALPSPFPKRRY